MKIQFSAYFWYWYTKKVDILEMSSNTIRFKNKNGEFEASKDKKSLQSYYLIKYSPLLILGFLIFSINEILTFRPIHLMAPLTVVLMQMFRKQMLWIISVVLVFSLGIFFYTDIKEFPFFIKYLIFFYGVSELIVDVISQRIMVVYLLTKKQDSQTDEWIESREMVSFAKLEEETFNENEKSKRSEK